jgi:hypothetical protein
MVSRQQFNSIHPNGRAHRSLRSVHILRHSCCQWNQITKLHFVATSRISVDDWIDRDPDISSMACTCFPSAISVDWLAYSLVRLYAAIGTGEFVANGATRSPLTRYDCSSCVHVWSVGAGGDDYRPIAAIPDCCDPLFSIQMLQKVASAKEEVESNLEIYWSRATALKCSWRLRKSWKYHDVFSSSSSRLTPQTFVAYGYILYGHSFLCN